MEGIITGLLFKIVAFVFVPQGIGGHFLGGGKGEQRVGSGVY